MPTVGASADVYTQASPGTARPNGTMAQATKVKGLIRAAQTFAALASRCQIMLHLPGRFTFVLPWDHASPISALRNKAFHECGLPPERQRLQVMGLDIVSATVGASGVLPGDVVEVVAN